MFDQIDPTGVIYKKLLLYESFHTGLFKPIDWGGPWLKIDDWGRGAATDRMHSVVASAAPYTIPRGEAV